VTWLLAGQAPAQVAVRQDGLFISVRNPIDSDLINNIKAKTRRALERKDRPIRTIVFDFNPGQGTSHPSATKEYGVCQELADFLLSNEVQNVTTVAFVHGEVSGHTVLPVLACREIVMSADAKLGAVTRDLSGPPSRSKIESYEEVARARSRCRAVILKMLDPNVEVVEGTWAGRGGAWWIDNKRPSDEESKNFVKTQQEPVLPAGSIAFYPTAQAKKFGLCNLVRESRQDVAEAYQLTAASLREDPLEGREPVVFRITVAEPLTKAVGQRLGRQIRQAIGRRANFLILQLDCSSGDTQVAIDLAEEVLRNLKDDRGDLPVMTVAYLPKTASGVSTILAMGCTEIVMGRDARLGDFDSVVYERRGAGMGKAEVNPENYRMLARSLEDLAREQGYDPLLARGMLDRKLTIYQVRNQKEPNQTKLISEEEWQADQAADGAKKWGEKVLVKPGGEFFRPEAEKALNLGLARWVAEDFPDLCRQYGIKDKDVRDMGYDFLYRLAEFLAHPAVSVFLIMIGIACLILELKVPGVGLPGVIAAVCFVLYFWAQSHLAGQITTLAILLFILGLILIGLEIFVIPGSFLLGISGIILVVLSLALAAFERKPETHQEWMEFGQRLGFIGISFTGALLLAFVVAWYLPSIPYASRLILKAPSEDAAGEGGELGAEGGPGPEMAALLGAIGVAATTLRPAGIARFGDDFVDVVTEGNFVPAGNRVQVIEIEGNRVVVKEV